MNTVDEVTHLGITRRNDRRLTHIVEERVKRGRRTAYALFGAGLHGSNGIGTERSLLIYHSYVYPVFMYGLESMVLDKRSIDTLAAFHMSIIKELQGRPTRCANAAAYLVANQLPLPALLHIAILTLLCNIAISKNNSLEILLKRQCAMRVRKSWAMNAQDTLDIYDMGSIDDIFESDNPRLMKKHFKPAIRKKWNRRPKEECAGKSSLRWLHLPRGEQLHNYLAWHELPVAHSQSHNQGQYDDGVIHLTGWCKTVQPKQSQRHMSPLRYRWTREHRPLPVQVFLPAD